MDLTDRGCFPMDEGRELPMPKQERRTRGCWTALMSALVLFAPASLINHAFGAAPLTVEGEGTGSLRAGGTFSAQLPDGSKCSGTFGGGKISLLGHSEVTTSASCVNGPVTQPAHAVVDRWPNGLPRRVTLTFDDGSKVLVIIRLKSSHIMHKPPPATPPPNPWTQ
jgi:hypothetical protein